MTFVRDISRKALSSHSHPMSCLRILHRLSCLQTRLSDGFVNPKGFTSRHSKAGQNSMEKRKYCLPDLSKWHLCVLIGFLDYSKKFSNLLIYRGRGLRWIEGGLNFPLLYKLWCFSFTLPTIYHGVRGLFS